MIEIKEIYCNTEKEISLERYHIVFTNYKIPVVQDKVNNLFTITTDNLMTVLHNLDNYVWDDIKLISAYIRKEC